MVRLRIALTLSGAVSLGAYEGGAMAALLTTVEEIRRDDQESVVIDAIAGASAGSMTGVLVARSLLSSDDPFELMRTAWVDTPSLENLHAHGDGAPLSIEKVQAEATALLTGQCRREPGDAPSPQKASVKLRLALGALRGLDYSFRRLERPPLDAVTYLDWFETTLGPDSSDNDFVEALKPAMASGAHAAAFSAQMLRRDANRKGYEKNGVKNFPDTGCLWYTDGGTVDNQPLGEALEMTAELDEDLGDDNRLHLLVVPDPNFPVPSSNPAWADPDHPPDWIGTLTHAAKMTAAQSLYTDLRTAEKTNSRLRWSEKLVDQLAPLITTEARGQLTELVEEMDRVRSEDLGSSSSVPPDLPGESDPHELLRRALHAATGLHGKRAVAIDAISPRLIGADNKSKLDADLAGEFLGHFGGFLSLAARESDFALGYLSALAWMADPARGLQFSGIPNSLVEPALVKARAKLPDPPPSAKDLDLVRLGPRVWMQLMELAWRAVKLAESGLRTRTGHHRGS